MDDLVNYCVEEIALDGEQGKDTSALTQSQSPRDLHPPIFIAMLTIMD